MGEACRKAEEESSRLTDERLSLVMDLGAVKDEFASFREKAAADRETMEAEFDSNGYALFNYGYGCCVFTHNIYGSKPHIPDGMSDPSVLLTQNSSPTPNAPQASRQQLQPWIQLRRIRRLARLLPEKRRFFRWIPQLNRIPLLSSVKFLVET